MNQNEIAKKYSLALFELGREQKKLAECKKGLEEVIKTINEYNDLKKILLHPRVMPDDKKKVIQDIFTSSIPGEVLNFLKLLIDKRRELYLDVIYKHFLGLVNEEENILEVEVTSAIELSDELKDKLQNKLVKLLNSKIIIKEKTNPEIIGGMILKIGDRVIDGSIRHDLESLKGRILQIPVSELGV